MSTAGVLCEFLEELSPEELHDFQCSLPNWKGVGKADDALPVVKFMINTFGPDEAVRRTISILRDIKQDQLAKQLEAFSKEIGKQRKYN